MKKAHFIALAACLFASCATPPGDVRSSSGRDALGHRPGPKGFRTVIIDAGHGGEDSGAQSWSTGQLEKTWRSMSRVGFGANWPANFAS